MKDLAILLHFYQPPTQIAGVLKNIVETCYRPLSQLILNHPKARFVVNINYSLTEQLFLQGYSDIIYFLSQAARLGHIEFTESSAYHYLLPLSSHKVVLDQLKRNYIGNRSHFGHEYQPRGIFPPEMAFSPDLPLLIRKANYQWIIADDIALGSSKRTAPSQKVLTVNGVPVVLRSRLWSSRIGWNSSGEKHHHISGREYLEWFKRDLDAWIGPDEGYLILALDAETFGHHMPGYIEDFLESLLDGLEYYPDIRLSTISDILNRFSCREECQLSSSSWSTSTEQIEHGDPFPLWKSPLNPIHQAHWEFVNRVLELAERFPDLMAPRIDSILAKAQYSCQFWWANPDIFYDPEQVIRGADMFLQILKIMVQEDLANEEEVRQAIKSYANLRSWLQLPVGHQPETFDLAA